MSVCMRIRNIVDISGNRGKISKTCGSNFFAQSLSCLLKYFAFNVSRELSTTPRKESFGTIINPLKSGGVG